MEPLAPGRIYVESPQSVTALDLWPFASVSERAVCEARELFLLDRVNVDAIILKSLRDHTTTVDLGTPP